MKRLHKIELYQDKAGFWRWHRKAGNGEIISDSAEGYVRARDAIHGARIANPDLLGPDSKVETSAEDPENGS